jgi:hypothetical protein
MISPMQLHWKDIWKIVEDVVLKIALKNFLKSFLKNVLKGKNLHRPLRGDVYLSYLDAHLDAYV